MLLEDHALRAGTLSQLSRLVGADLSHVSRFLAEQVHEDRARPDVVGLDPADRPLVVIEAKFGAELTVDQINSYLRDQGRRIHDDSGSPDACLLILLVPQARVAEAKHKLQRAFREEFGEAEPPSNRLSLVLSWDDWLDMWDTLLADVPDSADGLRADVVQLRAMCLSLGGLVIAPLGVAASGEAWRTREDGNRVVVDEVTRALSVGTRRLYPIGDEGVFRARRYFDSGYATGDGGVGAAAVGVHTGFADAGGSPIWLRFHKDTTGFLNILGVVMGSGLGDGGRRDGGHLWLPLHVDPDLGGIDLVSDLVEQVRRIQSSLASRA
jgi:hypothetical protein